jgi:hypothetical protein
MRHGGSKSGHDDLRLIISARNCPFYPRSFEFVVPFHHSAILFPNALLSFTSPYIINKRCSAQRGRGPANLELPRASPQWSRRLLVGRNCWWPTFAHHVQVSGTILGQLD